jgi:hypothetical protein
MDSRFNSYVGAESQTLRRAMKNTDHSHETESRGLYATFAKSHMSPPTTPGLPSSSASPSSFSDDSPNIAPEIIVFTGDMDVEESQQGDDDEDSHVTENDSE